MFVAISIKLKCDFLFGILWKMELFVSKIGIKYLKKPLMWGYTKDQKKAFGEIIRIMCKYKD